MKTELRESFVLFSRPLTDYILKGIEVSNNIIIMYEVKLAVISFFPLSFRNMCLLFEES